MTQTVPTAFLDMHAIAKMANENAWNKGFHQSGGTTDEKFPRWCMLIVSEIAEAMEAHRCQEGQARIGEELADAVIRIFDTAYAMGINIGNSVYLKMEANSKRPKMHGGKLY